MGPKIGGHYRQVVVRFNCIMFVAFYGVTGSVFLIGLKRPSLLQNTMIKMIWQEKEHICTDY